MKIDFGHIIISIAMSISSNSFAKYPVYSREYYISIVKNKDETIPISINTVITPVYHEGNLNIVHYSNVNDETKHGQARILILKNWHYTYSYQADDTSSCFVYHEDIRCVCEVVNDIIPYSDIRISDLANGKNILVCGDLSEAFRREPPRRAVRRRR